MKLVICGSMKHCKKMVEVKDELEKMGHGVGLPTMMDGMRDFHIIRDEWGDEEKFLAYKRKSLKDHIQRIKEADAILVLNYEKNNIENYIGGNTLIEMGVAYELGKKIFLLNPIPRGLSYTEEIQTVEPIVLNKNLKMIK